VILRVTDVQPMNVKVVQIGFNRSRERLTFTLKDFWLLYE